MKIRTGFVSNSSSSSFCLLGINAKDEWIYEYDVVEEFEKKFDSSFLEIQRGLENFDGYIVGISPYSIEKNYSDKTINEIKILIRDTINDVFNADISEKSIEFFVDGGMDY